ncbi:type II toxin-antitoxin system RelE/ParE family toxin [Moraxella nonliquefaciens]|nr:type II toxin-antitoxin system RelE/ParE family toxin [Moraxella nonliquefaciens]MCG7411563.1 type II toxin-antitoxin system RelE/ParE family toxin [Moraxella nonliquefaciens]
MQLLTFIETSIFTKAIKELFDDDEYRKIQNELLNDPQKGDLIQGTGGLRKIRFGRNSGKSSGVRILYYYTDKFGRIYLFAVYPKSVKDNITNAEKAVFKTLITILKQELKNG